MSTYYLPGIGGQIEDVGDTPYQSAPLLNTYSPRLFGSPPQLTHYNDMRLMSGALDKSSEPGPVGDFYLTNILQDAQIANFVVGKALFTGGMSSLANIIRVAAQYGSAMSKYNVFDSYGNAANGTAAATDILNSTSLDSYNAALLADDGTSVTITAGTIGATDLDKDTTVADLSSMDNAKSLLDMVSNLLPNLGQLATPIYTSLSVQQPFYTFESDWSSYINNVKMMINTAVIMLGLQNACVRIGDYYYPIGLDANVKEDNDVWSNYRFITPNKGLGDINAIDNISGDMSQYVSFMIEPSGASENFSNTIGESQLYSSVMKSGSDIGAEIAFITNSAIGQVGDTIINLAGSSINAAEKVLTSMTAGTGRFTAAIAGSMARSFVGDNTIYPEIFKSHTSTSSQDISITLNATGGDPFSYLTEILVPYFFILGMVIPAGSRNSAAAYTYPPLVQVSIPGMWGSRLAMIESVTVTKNVSDSVTSIHGYPTSIKVSIKVKDLQHVLVTSGMNKISMFLNNHTMFDYIAQCAGVDKYRINGSIRLVSKLALAASAATNVFNNIGDAVLNDFSSFANRLTGISRF